MRNAFTRCIVTLALVGIAASAAHAQLRSELFVGGFSQPVAMIQDPTNPDVFFVVQQGGLIRVVVNGVVQGTNFLSMVGQISTGGERGLLGMAFDPDYANNRRFYLNFTNPSGHTVIARFKRSEANPLVADAGSRFDLRWGGPAGVRWITQDFGNHNGGTIAFSPVDGYLYIAMGDGGSGNDPNNRAQNPNSRLGKILRIDVNVADAHTEGFVIPKDNPFVDGNPINALHEIWAFGMRNPWKWSFDDPTMGGTGAMVVGDVGQVAREEVNYEPAGAGGRNYGWPKWEGNSPGANQNPLAYKPPTFPIHDYARTPGGAVTGGYVYRGTNLGSYCFSRYFFGDFGSSNIWSIGLIVNPATGEATAVDLESHTSELGPISNPSSFAVDSNGEVYFLNYSGGTIRRIVRSYDALAPASFNLFRGFLVSGNLASLADADNDRMVMRPGFVLSTLEAPIQLIVEATSPTSNTSDMRFIVKSHSSVNNIRQQVELFDFVANEYVLVDNRLLQTFDYTIQSRPSNPNRFIQAGTQLVRARISFRQNGPVLAFPWQARVDQANWRFRN